MAAHTVICGDTRLTADDLDARCRSVWGLLDAYQVESGERVAVLGTNSVPYLELYLGVPMHGRVVVPLNHRWSDAELRYALRDSGARLLFIDRPAGALAVEVDAVVRTDLEYEQLLAEVPPAEPEVPALDALAGLFYTGGTTGASKGVMLTHRNLQANAEAMRRIAPLGADDTWLVMAPMFHAAGTISVLQCVEASVPLVLTPFDPAVVLDTIERERVTHTLAVPTMLGELVREQQAHPRDVSSLRVLMHGASPITPALIGQALHTFGTAELVHLYGTTETAPIITALRHEDADSRSVGEPVGCEVVLLADGEVCVRGPNVMAGYWNKEDATAQVLDDGWYRTGDIGRLDGMGRLYLLDRRADVIITGGENVYTTEVEAALCAHPAVVECAVFGQPDDKWGETVCAAVVTRAEVTPEDLIAHCRDLIAGYKLPRQVRFVDALPKSGAGKVLKRQLRTGQ